MYAYRRLNIYGPLALEKERTNQDNQQSKKASKVTYSQVGKIYLTVYDMYLSVR